MVPPGTVTAEKETPMRQLMASPATRDPAAGDRDDRDGRHPEPSRVWAWLEALAASGAFIDPTGVLNVERLRRAREEQRDR
jgi:hypothetical protein